MGALLYRVPFNYIEPGAIASSGQRIRLSVTLDALDGDIVSRGIGTYRIYTKSLVKTV